MGRIWEKPKSQSGEVPFFGQTSTREFAASGVYDESDLVALILANPAIVPLSNTVNGNYLFIENFSYKEFGGGCWDVTAHYKSSPDQKRLSIDTSGGTRKKFYSDETVQTYRCDLTTSPPDFEKAIGVTQNGVDGVDVIDPKFDFTINKSVRMSSLSSTYISTLRDLTGCVNNASYTILYQGQEFTFATEELLFKGATFNQTSQDEADFNYKFSGAKSVAASDNQSIGLSAPIVKAGWQYLWVYFQEVNDTTSGRLIRQPISAYVERVFKRVDLNQIAL